MDRLLQVLVLLIGMLGISLNGSGCQTAPQPGELHLEVFNPHGEQWVDAPVTLHIENLPLPLTPVARVFRQHADVEREVPSQLDDVDGDGSPDQLFFLVNLDANETARYVVRRDSTPVTFPRRVDLALDSTAAPDRSSPAIVTRPGLRSFDEADSIAREVVVDGPLRTIVRTSFQGVPVDTVKLNVIIERERHAGNPWVLQRLRVDGVTNADRLAAGIPRLTSGARLQSGTESGVFYMFSASAPGAGVDTTAVALMIFERFRPRLDPGNGGDFRLRFSPQDGRAFYVYVALDEPAEGALVDREQALRGQIGRAAKRLLNPVQVTARD